MLFEIAVLEHPKKDKDGESDQLEKLVFGPKFVIAEDDQTAVMAVVMDHPEEFKKINKKRMEVLIRPFG
jgi:hypothetical protein